MVRHCKDAQNLENKMQTQCWFCPHCYAENVFEHTDDCPNKLSEQQLKEYHDIQKNLGDKK